MNEPNIGNLPVSVSPGLYAVLSGVLVTVSVYGGGTTWGWVPWCLASRFTHVFDGPPNGNASPEGIQIATNYKQDGNWWIGQLIEMVIYTLLCNLPNAPLQPQTSKEERGVGKKELSMFHKHVTI
jgi:hypothetical protein